MPARPPLLALLALAAAGCVVWPAGTGPQAGPIPVKEALAMRERGEAVIVDVRGPQPYAEGHIPGAVRIGSSEVAERAPELRRLGRLPILYCG
jgi:rhodanese-related sulfurtransferase